MTGACASMFLMKSWVILSSSSTSLMLRGAPPPERGGIDEGGLFIGGLKDVGGGVTLLTEGALEGTAEGFWLAFSLLPKDELLV